MVSIRHRPETRPAVAQVKPRVFEGPFQRAFQIREKVAKLDTWAKMEDRARREGGAGFGFGKAKVPCTFAGYGNEAAIPSGKGTRYLWAGLWVWGLVACGKL